VSLLGPQLDAFVAVARARSVRYGARELHITQTGVTQRIRVLERGIGATLFVRSRRGMTLTPEGQALLRYCEAARDLEGQALARIHGAGTRSEVRLSLTGPTSILRARIIPQCIPVLRALPDLLMTFDIVDLRGRADALRSGLAQLAVLSPEDVAREMDSKRLKPERYVLVASAAWRRRPLRDVLRGERIVDFDSTDDATHAYLRRFGLLEDARGERHFANNTEAVVDMFKAQLGYGVLTQEFARPFVERGELSVLNGGAVHENALALAWYPRATMPPYFARVLKAIR
jgi:DNA-binding transcriptional LysR family regulator